MPASTGHYDPSRAGPSDSKAGTSVNAQVESYQGFVEDVLRVDLKKAQENKGRLEQELRELEELEHNITVIQKEGLTQLKTQVEIGPGVYYQAQVPDATKICVRIGLGFHVEATLPEALLIISMRRRALQDKIEESQHQSARIKAHIKMVEATVGELQGLQQQEGAQQALAGGSSKGKGKAVLA